MNLEDDSSNPSATNTEVTSQHIFIQNQITLGAKQPPVQFSSLEQDNPLLRGIHQRLQRWLAQNLPLYNIPIGPQFAYSVNDQVCPYLNGCGTLIYIF